MKKVLCFGELLLRLSPDENGNWLAKNKIGVFIGGSELNVAAALGRWNVSSKYITALPESYLSKSILNNLSKRKIDISSVIFSGNKIGIYYLQQGTELKNASVIYDRANSSLAELKSGAINWNEILQDVSWLHFSAITAAINLDVCKEAIELAAKENIMISVDLNYRSKLWQNEKKPVEIMPALIKHCDVVMGNIWSANTLLGMPLDEKLKNYKSKSEYIHHANETAKNISEKFSKCKVVANTFRFDKNENGIKYFATLFMNEKQFVSKEFSCNKIVTKVGSGDCLMAALIYGLINTHSPQKIIDFSAAAAFGKLQEETDSTNQSLKKIHSIIKEHGKIN